jgi:UDP:flavonoid glycosyltransferase YjiC (YdhE family)
VFDGLADSANYVVGTSAAHDPQDFDTIANARVEGFVAHDPIGNRSTVAVCHRGMGIT